MYLCELTDTGRRLRCHHRLSVAVQNTVYHVRAQVHVVYYGRGSQMHVSYRLIEMNTIKAIGARLISA